MPGCRLRCPPIRLQAGCRGGERRLFPEVLPLVTPPTGGHHGRAERAGTKALATMAICGTSAGCQEPCCTPPQGVLPGLCLPSKVLPSASRGGLGILHQQNQKPCPPSRLVFLIQRCEPSSWHLARARNPLWGLSWGRSEAQVLGQCPGVSVCCPTTATRS